MEAWQADRCKETIIVLSKSTPSKMNIHTRKYHVALFRPVLQSDSSWMDAHRWTD